MRIIALILTLFCFVLVSSQEDIREARQPFRNLLKNPGAENGKSGVAVSNPANLSISQTAANVAAGKSSFQWAPTVATETILFGVASPTNEAASNSCLAAGKVRANAAYPTGRLVARVENSGSALTTDLDLGPFEAGEWKPFQIAFSCPASGSVDLEFEVDGAATFNIDSLWLGRDYRLGQSGAEISQWYEITPTWQNVTLGDGSAQARWRRVGEYMEVQGNLALGGTSVVTGNIIMTVPDGKTADFMDAASYFQAGVATAYDASTAANRKQGSVLFSANIGTQIRFSNADGPDWNATTPFTWAPNDVIHFTASFPIAEWRNGGTSQTVTLETQGWWIEADIGGVNVNLPAADFSFQVPDEEGLTLQAKSGSADVQIACDGAAPQPTSCTGIEQVGIVFDAPYAGLYNVCWSGTAYSLMDDNESARLGIKLAQTNITDDTILQDGANSIHSAFGPQGTGGLFDGYFPYYLCQVFQLSAGQTAIKTFAAGNHRNNVNILFLALDRTGGVNGRRTSVFTVYPITQNFPQAVALSSVETNAGNDGCKNGNICSGTVDLVFTNESAINVADGTAIYNRIGDTVTLAFRFNGTAAGHVDHEAWLASIEPVPFLKGNFSDAFQAGGSCAYDIANANSTSAQILSITADDRIQIAGRYDGTACCAGALSCTITYDIQD